MQDVNWGFTLTKPHCLVPCLKASKYLRTRCRSEGGICWLLKACSARRAYAGKIRLKGIPEPLGDGGAITSSLIAGPGNKGCEPVSASGFARTFNFTDSLPILKFSG